VLNEHEDVDVRWICDIDGSRVSRIARRYPGIVPTRDLDDVLGDPRVDGVLLATPIATHHELARRCLRADKHTLVEKPLASSADQATELIELASKRDLVLMCGHTFLYSPPVRRVRELIDGGQLGELYFVSSSRVNLGLHQPDVSVIWDLGPHDFSILLYWLGEFPSTIRATGRDSIVAGTPDVAFVTLQFSSGLVANVELSWLAPSKLRRTVVVGSRQMVVYEDGAAEAIKIYDRGVDYKDPETFGEWHLSYRAGDILTPKLSNDEPLSLQVADFVRAVTSRHVPETDLTLARDVVRLAEAADDSLKQGSVNIALDDRELTAEPLA
jgi:predicted dehydrogenase